jgi:hypothetical protein
MRDGVGATLLACTLMLTGAGSLVLVRRAHQDPLVAAEPPPTGAWQVYRSAAGGYQVRFPQLPEVYQLNGVTYARAWGPAPRAQCYLASYSDHPPDEIAARGVESVLTSTQRGFEAVLAEGAPAGAAIRSEELPLSASTMSGGREVKLALLDNPNGQRVLAEHWARVYIVGGRIFVVAVKNGAGPLDGDSARSFLRSFRFGVD